MVFDTNFKEEMTQQLIAALSFALEADAEVLIDKVEQVRKVINTYTYSFHGEFAALEMFGEFYGTFAVKDNLTTIMQFKFKFGDSDTESIIKCGSSKALLDGLTNAYNIYRTRKAAMPRIYPKLVQILDKIEKMAPDTKPLTDEIKSLFGTDIELVSELPKEKEH